MENKSAMFKCVSYDLTYLFPYEEDSFELFMKIGDIIGTNLIYRGDFIYVKVDETTQVCFYGISSKYKVSYLIKTKHGVRYFPNEDVAVVSSIFDHEYTVCVDNEYYFNIYGKYNYVFFHKGLKDAELDVLNIIDNSFQLKGDLKTCVDNHKILITNLSQANEDCEVVMFNYGKQAIYRIGTHYYELKTEGGITHTQKLKCGAEDAELFYHKTNGISETILIKPYKRKGGPYVVPHHGEKYLLLDYYTYGRYDLIDIEAREFYFIDKNVLPSEFVTTSFEEDMSEERINKISEAIISNYYEQ